jgi:deoxyribodipyrimidine photo-lyase
MWFASIWIFTLRLPWALGADFFLRHLLDADAASNTLSWRWVAGLQTVGKTYLATAENIARHTRGRFAPVGLATEAVALTEAPPGVAATLPALPPHDPREPTALLVTPEDLHPESLFARVTPFEAAIVAADGSLMWGDAARRFADAAATDAVARTAAHFGCPVSRAGRLDLEGLCGAARAAGVRRIVTPYAPVGPVADALARLAPALTDAGITLAQVRRDWDARCWPHAQKGFFAFRERMPAVLGELGLA